MCGIVGYVGSRPVLPVLLDGLRRLEYRGYDSAGVALQNSDGVLIRKACGRLSVLEARVTDITEAGGFTAGMGHTRWATHGRPSDENSHPHCCLSGTIAVVHNGIIENYQRLRHKMEQAGHHLVSETDTEVIPHLIEEYYQGDLVAATRAAMTELEGSFALLVMSSEEPGLLVAVRKDSPLVIGLGEGENFVASDIPAVMEYTKRTFILDDGELAVVRSDGVEIQDGTGAPKVKPVFDVPWDVQAAEKGGYPHFMLKEIYEQPKAMEETLRGRLIDGGIFLPEFGLDAETAKGIERIHLVACGTSHHACLVGKYLIERLARLPVEVDVASEFRYREPLVTANDLVIAVSQSGETADTLAALREGRRRGARGIAVCNVVGSTIAREAEAALYTRAGLELAVASTKAYVTQVVALTLLAVELASLRGLLGAQELGQWVSQLQKLPQWSREALALAPEIETMAQELARWEHAFFIGRGLDYAVALEGQLKLKEISYIHAEAYAAGELKHGTLALIVDDIPVVALATQSHVFGKTISNITEVRARGGKVFGFSKDKAMAQYVDRMLVLPDCPDLLAPAVAVIPLQLLSYYTALIRECDVDKPRNLAKSVTVE